MFSFPWISIQMLSYINNHDTSLWFNERKIKLVSMVIQITWKIDSMEIVWNCCLATLFLNECLMLILRTYGHGWNCCVILVYLLRISIWDRWKIEKRAAWDCKPQQILLWLSITINEKWQFNKTNSLGGHVSEFV